MLDGLSSWDAPEYMIEDGDYTDMNGYGYFLNPDGTVYREAMVNYMNLEFYNGPYKMNERILPALSRFVKGKLSLDLLLCAYRKVLLDLAADDIMPYPSDILEELGLLETEE